MTSVEPNIIFLKGDDSGIVAGVFLKNGFGFKI